MVLELEGLEQRLMPDAGIPTIGQIIAQGQAIIAIASQANAFIQATFPPTSTSLVTLLAGLQATALLEAQVAQDFAQLLPDITQTILAASTL